LEKEFLKPPDEARPWVYAFFVNGNMTSNGITADLEAMKRAGIGGMLVFEVDQGAPRGKVEFGSNEFRGLFQHLCKEAKRLGLKVSVNNDAGWCGSGGPWITPELSMQKVVWGETNIDGGRHFDGMLEQPERIANFYRDIAVLAFPTPPADEVKMADSSPKMTLSAGDSDAAAQELLDGNLNTVVTLPHPWPSRPQYIQIKFERPFTARQLKLGMAGLARLRTCHGLVEASDDGKDFRTICGFEVTDTTALVNFDAVTAKYFRVKFINADYKLKDLRVTELELSPRLRVDNIPAKALFVGKKEFSERENYPPAEADASVTRNHVVDLTEKLDKDGRLEWDVPAGRWTVIRFGHTTTGGDNHPAPEGGRGLECDKLSKAGAEATFDGLLAKLTAENAGLVGDTLVSTHIDSWEVGPQNWTENFTEEFKRLRGYDILKFLPVLTGRTVENLEISERFLWDFRQTISDLLVENYAGRLHELARQHGLRLSIEAYDGDPCDDLTYAGRADEPMGEFWSWVPYGLAFSCTEMASAAHVYGKPIVGAEAFTAAEGEKWLGHPFGVKAYGDWAFCEGVNHLVVHRYAFQPWTGPGEPLPGMAMGPFGLHYERTQTWWDYSRPWHEYLARCQYLLRQGQFVADICYLAPEKAPQRWQPPHPSLERSGYNFDGCPPEVVMKRMTLKDGRLVLPDGMSYGVLALPDSATMTPGLLGKIKELVEHGATVVGRRPVRSPGFSNYPRCDEEVKRLADELWGDCDGKVVKEHRLGKGRVVWGGSVEEVIANPKSWRTATKSRNPKEGRDPKSETEGASQGREEGLPPDFEARPTESVQRFRYIHRRIGETDIYFVANKLAQSDTAWCSFRVTGKAPEFWWPDSGRIECVAEYSQAGGMTKLPVRLEPGGSVFVVFRPNARNRSESLVSVTRNGKPILANGSELLETTGDVTNTFSVVGWVKPEAIIELPAESTEGIEGLRVKRNDALYPPPGHEAFTQPNQAGSGISVGENGVCAYEHGCGHFAPVLVFGTPITNWTHVAVVYSNGTPILFLDGKLVHEGAKSSYVVHAGVGVQHWRNPAPFAGEEGTFVKFDRALSGEEVCELKERMRIPGTVPEVPVVEFSITTSKALEAEVWEEGRYAAKAANGTPIEFQVDGVTRAIEIGGPWDVRFTKGWGAPEEASFEKLISWNERPEPGMRDYSGTATYRTTFELAPELLGKGKSLFLDLGKVAIIAAVKLNGKELGVLWKPPFRVDISGIAKPGKNNLEVQVVNLWVNRMIGDEQLPEDSARGSTGELTAWPDWLKKGMSSPSGRYTFTTWRLWKKNSPLQESGLLGPVVVREAKRVLLK
jgi:hypothetical protein